MATESAPCLRCGGSGKDNCPRCYEGQIYVSQSFFTGAIEMAPCPDCNATGWKPCEPCGGSGRMPS